MFDSKSGEISIRPLACVCCSTGGESQSSRQLSKKESGTALRGYRPSELNLRFFCSLPKSNCISQFVHLSELSTERRLSTATAAHSPRSPQTDDVISSPHLITSPVSTLTTHHCAFCEVIICKHYVSGAGTPRYLLMWIRR